MQLIEVFLPLYDRDQQRFERDKFEAVERTLVEHFGGFTCYPRAPATGIWRNNGTPELDELVIYEVMTSNVDKNWWAAWRAELEQMFHQDEVLIRSHRVEQL